LYSNKQRTLGVRFHSEGSIISTLFGLLFWDILFAPIPGAFETPYQSAPLDLFHDSFVSARQNLIDTRLAELVDDECAARRIIESVDERERDTETWCIGVRWDQFEREDLLEIVDVSYSQRCFSSYALLLASIVSRRPGFSYYMPIACRRVRLPGRRRP
jgi:Fanconi-associated nuclease 1